MNNSDKIETASQFETTILFTMSGIELLLNLIELPISVLNIYLISRTSLIHMNLKFILLYQSAWIFFRGIGRFAICLLKFFTADALSSEQFQPMRFVYQLSAYNRNFVAHILIIERIMATFLRKNYERTAGWSFSIGWITIVFFISLYDTVTTSAENTSIFGLITTLALLILGAIELFIFIWLWRFNKKAYKKSLTKENLHCLTERYQLSENIRIGKQLMPTVILQLLNVAFTSAYLSVTNFGIEFYPNICLMVVVTMTTLFGLLVEVTMITHHPFLSRNLHQILRNFAAKLGFHTVQVHAAQNYGATPAEVGDVRQGIAMRDIINGQILTQNGDHFAMLKDSWEGAANDTKNKKHY